MIQELWWSGVFGGLLGLWLTPESGHVVCMSSLFRLPHTLCRYHPYTGINTRCLFLLSLPAWHVCVCVCRGSCMSFACLWASSLISPLRLTEGNKIQHHCNIQIPAPWHDFDMLPVSTIFSKHCHHSLEPAGSQMNKSVLVWAPHHFYWLVATCFCCCYMAWSVDSRERVKEISTHCNIFSVLSFLVLFIVEICLWFSRQWQYISSLADSFTNSNRSLFIIVSLLRKHVF